MAPNWSPVSSLAPTDFPTQQPGCVFEKVTQRASLPWAPCFSDFLSLWVTAKVLMMAWRALCNPCQLSLSPVPAGVPPTALWWRHSLFPQQAFSSLYIWYSLHLEWPSLDLSTDHSLIHSNVTSSKRFPWPYSLKCSALLISFSLPCLAVFVTALNLT